MKCESRNQDTPLECGADRVQSEPEPSQLSQGGAWFVLNHIVTKMTGCLMTAGMTGLGLADVGTFLTLITLVSFLLGMYDKNDSGESCHEHSQTFGR